jgi:hypothetical protein
MVHRRELEGKELVFGVHGALHGNAMTWWDHDTGSIWSQPTGEAILGPRKGARLELLPSTLTTWDAWRQAHPATHALDVAAGQSGFDLARMVIVVDFGVEAAAYPVARLQEGVVVNDVVAGAPIAVLADPAQSDRWTLFSRRLDDAVVTLVREGDEILDVETGTAWDPVRGIALSGPLQGEVLDLLPGFTAFPDDFSTFWPDGRIWQ